MSLWSICLPWGIHSLVLPDYINWAFWRATEKARGSMGAGRSDLEPELMCLLVLWAQWGLPQSLALSPGEADTGSIRN